jgi:DNA-binding XRE family transcriptional regulator
LTFQSIGKEADNIKEREIIGDDEDDVVEYIFARRDQSKLATFVKDTQRQLKISNRALAQCAHVSHHTINALHAGKHLPDASLRKLAQAVELLAMTPREIPIYPALLHPLRVNLTIPAGRRG